MSEEKKEYVVIEQKEGSYFSPLIIGIEKKGDEEIHRVNAMLDIWCNSFDEAFKEGTKYLER